MGVEIRVAGKSDAKDWDRIVDESPHGTLFHKWEWLKIMEKYSGARFYPVIGHRDHNIIGLYPLFHKRRFVNMVFSPPPHLAVLYLGPLIAGYEKLKQSKRESLFKNFQEVVDKFISEDLKGEYIHLMTSPNLPDSRPFTWAGYDVQFRFNYINSLDGGADYVWFNIDKKLRQSIEKSKRMGVVVRDGDKSDLKKIFYALEERYIDQGKKTKVPLDYLLEVLKIFRGDFKIYVAEHGGEFVTGVVDLCFKDTISSWLGNPKSKMEGLNANDLLNWTAIEWGCKSGFRYYITMGAAGNERLHSYYSKFNPNLLVSFAAFKHRTALSKISRSLYSSILKPAGRRV